jgi:hypothetical protein
MAQAPQPTYTLLGDKLIDGDVIVQIYVAGQPRPFYEKDKAIYCAIAHESEYSVKVTSNESQRADVTINVDKDNEIGVWRLNGYSNFEIDRPVDKAFKLTFMQEKSEQAKEGGIVAGESKNGIVSIEWKPERRVERQYVSLAVSKGLGASRGSRGGQESYQLQSHDRDSASESRWAAMAECSEEPRSRGILGVSAREQMQAMMQASRGGVEQKQAMPQVAMSFSSGATVLGKASNQKFNDASIIDDFDHSKKKLFKFRMVVIDEPKVKYQPIKDKRPLTPPRVD